MKKIFMCILAASFMMASDNNIVLDIDVSTINGEYVAKSSIPNYNMNFSFEKVREEGLFEYSCSINSGTVSKKTGSKFYLINNSVIFNCKSIDGNKINCKLRIFNVDNVNVEEDKKNIDEMIKNKICSNYTHTQKVDEYNFILNKNSGDSLNLGNKYKFNYSIIETN